jgi:carbon-monoxide dehydrogenase medium subunit
MAIRAFHHAATPEEAIRLLRTGPAGARFLAGGTDILPAPARPEAVVSIRDLFRYVKRDGADLVIGATATVSMVADSEDLAAADGGLLRSCALDFATWQVRNLATVGGNLASGVPSADFAPPLLVLDARCVILGDRGRREVPLGNFFTGPHATVLGRDLLAEIRFAAPSPRASFAWNKAGRIDGDLATVNAAVRLEIEGKTCRGARIALGAVAPTPIRAEEAEKYLTGKSTATDVLARAAVLAAESTRPISDQRASAEYRKHMSEVLVRRALEAASGGRARP